jgi:hypothetical protein
LQYASLGRTKSFFASAAELNIPPASVALNMSKFSSKESALSHFEKTRKEFLEECREVARKVCERKGYASIDDVREMVKTPKGVSPKIYGAVFNTKEWQPIGYTRTQRSSSHGRIVGVYEQRRKNAFGFFNILFKQRAN